VAGPFNFGALAAMLEPGSWVVRYLSNLSFFSLWQVVVTGIGLAVLYRKKTAGPTTTVVVLYLTVIAIWTTIASLASRG